MYDTEFPPLPTPKKDSWLKVVRPKIDWLNLPKYVWKLIFIRLAATGGQCDVFTLRPVCRFLRDAASIRVNGMVWRFRVNRSECECVRRDGMMFSTYKDPKFVIKMDRIALHMKMDRRSNFRLSHGVKTTPHKTQDLESISWCRLHITRKRVPKTTEPCPKRKPLKRKKKKSLRCPRTEDPWFYDGYIPTFFSIEEAMKSRPWAVIELLPGDLRKCVDPVTRVVYYQEKSSLPCYTCHSDIRTCRCDHLSYCCFSDSDDEW